MLGTDSYPKPPIGRPGEPPIDKPPAPRPPTPPAPDNIVKTVTLFGRDVPLWPMVGGVLILTAVITAKIRG